MMNPVGWFEIYTNDIDRAKAFYEALLAVELTHIVDPSDDGITMLGFPSNMDEYGASGALVYMQGVPAGGNSTLVYFSCEDCSIEQGRATAAGGSVERPKMSIGEHGFISLIKDTEGNMVGLHSMQ